MTYQAAGMALLERRRLRANLVWCHSLLIKVLSFINLISITQLQWSFMPHVGLVTCVSYIMCWPIVSWDQPRCPWPCVCQSGIIERWIPSWCFGASQIDAIKTSRPPTRLNKNIRHDKRAELQLNLRITVNYSFQTSETFHFSINSLITNCCHVPAEGRRHTLERHGAMCHSAAMATLLDTCIRNRQKRIHGLTHACLQSEGDQQCVAPWLAGLTHCIFLQLNCNH